jgi:hypothetical protein
MQNCHQESGLDSLIQYSHQQKLVVPLPSLRLFTWFQMFQKIKGENSFNNKSNSTPCNLDYNPSSGPII